MAQSGTGQNNNGSNLPGDRGSMAPLSRQTFGRKASGVAMLVGGLIFGSYLIFGENSRKRATTEEDSSTRISAPAVRNLDLPQEPLEPEPEPLPPPPQPEEIITMSELRPTVPDDSVIKRRMSSGFDSLSSSNNNTPAPPATASISPPAQPTLPEAPTAAVQEYDSQGVAKVTASRIGNRSLILTQGAKIPCTLETALDSSVPGMTSCIISQDVYSSDGKVRLIDRGSKLNGRYDSEIKTGQVRIAITWERLETPEGVLVNLSSPSTDPLGRAGASGWVDTHFWDRFGHAIMFSLVSDGFQYLNYKQQRNGNPNYFNDTEAAAQDMAKIALENEIDMKPTLHKNQGDPIMVFLNKDLSFEEVYELDLGNHKTPRQEFKDMWRESLYK